MKNIILFILFVLGGVNMVHAQGNNYTVRASIDVAYMFCDFKVNGVSSFDNRRQTFVDEGIVSTNTNVQILAKNGMNTIEIEVAPLSWFEPNKTNNDSHFFNKNAFCNINIYQTNSITNENQKITDVNILIGKDGVPQVYVNNKVDTSVDVIFSLSKNTEEVLFNKIRNVIGDFEYPKNVKLTKFKKNIELKNIPDWIWIKSDDFDESKLPELKLAYQELWDAFNEKDISKIRKLNYHANEAWALSSNSTEEKIFESYSITERVRDQSSKMIEITWDNFIPVVMNDRKMVKMIYKEDFSYSPITMIYLNNKGEELLYSFSPIFSFVNGKFIPVI
ncbi:MULTISPECIES: hypothetical protein [Providencia]|uniref:hypothetical protein n=1 Tax=unclassified Providencia TaxID=2633465 RepID=UPI001A2241D0|nr:MULTISPECIES: hypothetical protein [unclassified Providencia]